MKHMNIVVSVIIAVAVLVAAYGVGLLVRHVRMDKQLTTARQSPGDSNLPARIRQEREQMLEKVKTMSKEEKRRFTDEQVRSRFSAAGGRGQSRKISPEERAKIAEKLQSLSEQEKQAAEAHSAESKPASGEQTQAPANTEGATAPRGPEPGGSEPNKAGKG